MKSPVYLPVSYSATLTTDTPLTASGHAPPACVCVYVSECVGACVCVCVGDRSKAPLHLRPHMKTFQTLVGK